jgi:hypothetical protein
VHCPVMYQKTVHYSLKKFAGDGLGHQLVLQELRLSYPHNEGKKSRTYDGLLFFCIKP